jgi:hypothetical protein
MSNNDLACTNWAAAISALKKLVGILPRGTHRRILSEDEQKNITDFLKKTEGEQKGWNWYERGSEVINGELVPTEPDDGAEWPCRYNAEVKRWEPESKPPIIEKKTDFKTEDE